MDMRRPTKGANGGQLLFGTATMALDGVGCAIGSSTKKRAGATAGEFARALARVRERIISYRGEIADDFGRHFQC